MTIKIKVKDQVIEISDVSAILALSDQIPFYGLKYLQGSNKICAMSQQDKAFNLIQEEFKKNV